MAAIPWQITTLENVDSTNAEALRQVRESWQRQQTPHGRVIIAHRQSAGRGQHGRTWESPPGGLYMSFIIEEVNETLRDKLALIAGVAAALSLLHHHIPQITLRWPNDLMLADKKVGGILCEAAAEGPHWAAVIGIGINVNTLRQDLTSNLRPLATTLAEHTHLTLDKSKLATDNLTHFAATLAEAHREGIRTLAAQAQALDFLAGKTVEIKDANRTHAGIAKGFGDHGQLILQTPDGPVEFTTGTLLSVAGAQIRPHSG